MVTFYKKQKKYNEIQLPKNKMDFSNKKIKNHPTFPVPGELIIQASEIKNGNRKCGTNARLLSQTLMYGNGKKKRHEKKACRK